MTEQVVEFTHAHLFCGLGGGAKGFNKGAARLGSMRARFRCLGGIDVDPASIRDFERLAGVKGTVMDLFSLEQYRAFHGREPPPGWRERVPSDLHAAFNNEAPDVVFLSAPCKGFSGLLSETISLTDKYQALNQLTVRGVWLMLEAFKDSPPKLVIFENVPRIMTRGRPLLNIIAGLFRSYGYAWRETTHDCGEVGGLGQSRKRFLGVARHVEQVPPFLYEPEKRRLRGVGEILDRLPLPGDPRGGGMHRVPALQWKTWVRLAFVEAGSDWRSLNRLAVENGVLRDFGILPDQPWRDGALGVIGRDQPVGVITSQRSPQQGAFSLADVRTINTLEGSGYLGVNGWGDTAGVVAGESRPSNGAYSVADPRIGAEGPRFNNCYRIVRWDGASPAVTGQGGNSAGAVADPRAEPGRHVNGKYRVTPYAGPANAVIAASTTGNGASMVADPRCAWGDGAHQNKLRVVGYAGAASCVTGSDRVGSGALSVADPRPACLNRDDRDGYASQGHYGVVGWSDPSRAIPAFAKNNNGAWSVADPRVDMAMDTLPAGNDRLVCVIRALDGTWHRPFTTLELAALQSLVDPEDLAGFGLDGVSNSAWRERIGNAVPPDAAEAVAGVMAKTLLLAMAGETFLLSSTPIWVRPLAVALAVDTPAMEAP